MIPLFNPRTFIEYRLTAQENSLDLMGKMVRLDGSGGRFKDYWNQYITEFTDKTKYKLL